MVIAVSTTYRQPIGGRYYEKVSEKKMTMEKGSDGLETTYDMLQ